MVILLFLMSAGCSASTLVLMAEDHSQSCGENEIDRMDVRGAEQSKHWAQFFKHLFSSLLFSDRNRKVLIGHGHRFTIL